jgi:hypothetical protein
VGDELPLDPGSAVFGQPGGQRAGQRVALVHHADPGGRRVAGDEQAQERAATDDAAAVAGGFGQAGQPGTRAQRLHDQQRAE